jgi:ornithine cyclodeaminase/alanine dehydrogenase-like protein (mu-crystallin family)
MPSHAPGEILIVGRAEVESLLTPEDCLARVTETFQWVGRGEVVQTNPINLYVHDRLAPEPEYGHGVIQAFPALVRPLGTAAVKWLASYRKNPERGLPAISAIDLLTDANTGEPKALIDGTSITNMRTGAHAALGAMYLARPDSSTIAVIGCGNEARTHVRHLALKFDITKMHIFDTNEAAMKDFAADVERFLSIPITEFSSPREAIHGSDIICAVTTAPTPIIQEPWIEAGTHVCAATGFRDVDPECGRNFDKWVVGWYERDLEWIEGSEVGRLGGLRNGLLSRANIHADLAGELISGSRPGRESGGERTIMTHLGMPALDAAVADLVYQLAVDAGVGQHVRIF